jgi:hypothetical protein
LTVEVRQGQVGPHCAVCFEKIALRMLDELHVTICLFVVMLHGHIMQ